MQREHRLLPSLTTGALLLRPVFLAGVVPPYIVGLSIAYAVTGGIRIVPASLGLTLIWSVQGMTHLSNEYWDADVDAAAGGESRMSGGSGVLQENRVAPSAVLVSSYLALFFSIVLSLAILVIVNPPIMFFGIVAIAIILGWGYSTPPIVLSSRGLGELTAGIVVGSFVPMVGYLIHDVSINRAFVIATLPLFAIAFATSVSTAIPDIPADRQHGKRTMAVRIGMPRAVYVLFLSVLVGGILFSAFIIQLNIQIAMLGIPAYGLFSAVVMYFGYATIRGSISGMESLTLTIMVIFGMSCLALASGFVF